MFYEGFMQRLPVGHEAVCVALIRANGNLHAWNSRRVAVQLALSVERGTVDLKQGSGGLKGGAHGDYGFDVRPLKLFKTYGVAGPQAQAGRRTSCCKGQQFRANDFTVANNYGALDDVVQFP